MPPCPPTCAPCGRSSRPSRPTPSSTRGGCGPLAAGGGRGDRCAGRRRGRARPRGSVAGFERTAADAAALRAAAGRSVGAPADADRPHRQHDRRPQRRRVGHRLAPGRRDRGRRRSSTPAWRSRWPPSRAATALALRLIDPDGDAARPRGGRRARSSGPRTRLVALSHVSWATGARARRGRRGPRRARGRRPGAGGRRPSRSGPSRWTSPPWASTPTPSRPTSGCSGPEGLGALWVAPEAMERIDLTASGLRERHATHALGGRPGAATRARAATRSRPCPPPCCRPGGRRLEWLEGLGWEWIHGARGAGAGARRRAALAAAAGRPRSSRRPAARPGW